MRERVIAAPTANAPERVLALVHLPRLATARGRPAGDPRNHERGTDLPATCGPEIRHKRASRSRHRVVALAIVRIGPDLTTAFGAKRSSAGRGESPGGCGGAQIGAPSGHATRERVCRRERAQRLGSHSELSMSVGRAEDGRPGRPRAPYTLAGAGRDRRGAPVLLRREMRVPLRRRPRRSRSFPSGSAREAAGAVACANRGTLVPECRLHTFAQASRAVRSG